MIGSIIIPAHNEGRVIARTLQSVLRDLSADEVEVIVVANGCTDDTAAQAKAAAPGAVVVEVERPSKPHALRVGDSVATVLPRLYLDADIVLTSEAVRATLAVLSAGAVAARPPLRYETGSATWPVRRYYRARSSLPSVLSHAWGAGVYGLSVKGRSRFDEFPDVVGDDLFVDRLLTSGELELVNTDPAVVSTPRDTASLMNILRRAQRTKRDDGPACGDSNQPSQRAMLRDLGSVARSSGHGPVDCLVYATFAAGARLGGHRHSRLAWERDESSRSA